jgi:hypothetical protein
VEADVRIALTFHDIKKGQREVDNLKRVGLL